MTYTKMYWLHTLSPTHVGTGRGVGYIDLPIHRDKVTNWPVIPASAFKGVWADYYGATEAVREKDPQLKAAFGFSKHDNSNAGALIPTDARLVCLPVRSFRGTFAWCTSPLCLDMLKRDLLLTDEKCALPQLKVPAETAVLIAPSSALDDNRQVFLEDLNLQATSSPDAEKWADFIATKVLGEEWRGTFKSRFAVLSNDVFDFLTQTGTEVSARVRIDDDLKTVVDGALWNEELLPAESILAGLVACDRLPGPGGLQAANLLDRFAAQALTLQIGGKASVGRGRVRCLFTTAQGG